MFEHKIQMLVYTHYLKFHNYYKASFFRHLHIYYRCVLKSNHNPQGFASLGPEGFDKSRYSVASVIVGN